MEGTQTENEEGTNDAAAKAAAKAPAKKKSKCSAAASSSTVHIDPIEEVRARASAALPESCFEQKDLKELLPPECSI